MYCWRRALLLVIICFGIAPVVDSRRGRRKATHSDARARQQAQNHWTSRTGDRMEKTAAVNPKLGQLQPVVDELMRSHAAPEEWYRRLVHGRDGFSSEQAQALVNKLDRSAALQLPASGFRIAAPVSLLYGATWRALHHNDVHANTLATFLIKAGIRADDLETCEEPTYQGSTPLTVASLHQSRSHLFDAMLNAGGTDSRRHAGYRAEQLFYFSTSTWLVGLSKELLLRGSQSRHNELNPEQIDWIRHHHWLDSMAIPLSTWTKQSPTLTKLLAQYQSIPASPLPNNGISVAAAAVKLAIQEWMLPYVDALLEDCANGTSLCDLSEHGGDMSNWFQKGVVGGRLAHSFAAEGYSLLFDKLSQAYKEEVNKEDGMGHTPAQIAASKGYFDFPGARLAARGLGILDRPFRYGDTWLSPTPPPIVPDASGGWDPRRADIVSLLRNAGMESFELDRVDIDTYVEISQDSFLDHVSVARPFLLRRSATSTWTWKKTWQKTKFLQNFGSRAEFDIGKIPYSQELGGGNVHETLKTIRAFRKYASFTTQPSCRTDPDGAAETPCHDLIPAPSDTPLYIFNQLQIPSDILVWSKSKWRSWLADKHLEFLADYMRPEFVSPYTEEGGDLKPKQVQFYLGPAWSGAPWHYHDHAWNALAYGEKLWFLFPPAQAVYSNKPVLEWLREDLPLLPTHKRPLQVLQQEGEIVFVPAGWAHAVLNVKESIGIAEEFTLPE